MEKYVCVCSWEYDPAVGAPDSRSESSGCFVSLTVRKML